MTTGVSEPRFAAYAQTLDRKHLLMAPRALLLLIALTIAASDPLPGQKEASVFDSTFALTLPPGAVPAPNDPFGLGPMGATFDLPTYGGRGTLALIGFRALPYRSALEPAAWADSLRRQRAPTDPDARESALAGDVHFRVVPAGTAFQWYSFCGDCDLQEILVIGQGRAALIVYSYDDTRDVAREFGEAQLWKVITSIHWLR